MFRLLPSGLPPDPVFLPEIKSLGYFVNEDDEIRNIENHSAYFKFFITRNDRHNALQREAMNGWIRDEVLSRLEALNIVTKRLPLGSAPHEPHVPILVSNDLINKSRVIVLFYEHNQDLGVFAHRVIGGKGGINAGSAVDFVKHIQSLTSTERDVAGGAPGIVIANLGQLRWWRKGKKAITQTSWYALPQKSAVDAAPRFDLVKNTVPGHRKTSEHVASVFNDALAQLTRPDSRLDIIGVSEGAVTVLDFLNNEENWKHWAGRVQALALCAPYHDEEQLTNAAFRDFVAKRARVYVVSDLPTNTFIAGPDGKDVEGSSIGQAYGCPVFSLGEPYYTEMMLPKGHRTIIEWFGKVHDAGEAYMNDVLNGSDTKGDGLNGVDVEDGKADDVLLVQGEGEGPAVNDA